MANEVQCHCGRPMVPKHCPYCGGRFVYLRKRSGRVEMMPDPLQPGKHIAVNIKGWVCRACGDTFADDVPCGAPVKVQKATRMEEQAAKRAQRREAEGRANVLPQSPEEKALLIYRLAEKSPHVRAIQEAKGIDFSLPETEVIAQIAESMFASVDEAPLPPQDLQEAPQQDAPLRGSARGVYTDEIFDTDEKKGA